MIVIGVLEHLLVLRGLTMLDLSYMILDMTDEIELIQWDSKEYKMPFKAG